ncbi:Potassium voltage-gated channel subfamily H member 2, partial [Ophiophagus hannah]
VLKGFPDCLQADISLHLNRTLLQNCKAFQGASKGCLRALAMKFRTTHAPPGDTLVHYGDVLTTLYFISRGSIEILREDIVVAILGKNDIFGEPISLYARPGKSNADVRALTYCDLHKIHREDLLKVLDMYPSFSDNFWSNLEITFNLRDADSIPRSFLSEDYTCNYHQTRHHKHSPCQANKIDSDSMDAGNSDLEQCHGYSEFTPVQHPDMHSTTTSCSQISEEEAKMPNPIKIDPFTDTENNDFVPTVINLVTDGTKANQLHISLVHSPLGMPLNPEDGPRQIEAKLECLQAQLSRLESRMSSDINLILQLLQRQLSQVPPAYSSISPSSRNLSLYSMNLRNTEPDPSLGEEEMTPLKEIPNYCEIGKKSVKSRNLLSSGLPLSLALNDTVAINSQQEFYPQFLAKQEPHWRIPSNQKLFQGSRFHSLPEHLEATSEHLDIQRHLSDPLLPIE